MSNTITEGINSYLASLYINMSLKDWTPKSSYLVCRGLVDNGILHGDAVIGVLRERFLSHMTKNDLMVILFDIQIMRGLMPVVRVI